MTNDIINKELVNKIESLLKNAREKVVREVNNTLLIAYMEIGKAIVEDEKLHIDDIEYENKSLRYLSKVLTDKFGKGFSRWNLNYMISFYQNYSGQTLSSHLGWSHYCELLSISDKDKRSFYEKECSNARWSVRELRRQIGSSLYERLLLGGLNNKIFASKHITVLPKKEELIKQVEMIIDKKKMMVDNCH